MVSEPPVVSETPVVPVVPEPPVSPPTSGVEPGVHVDLWFGDESIDFRMYRGLESGMTECLVSGL